MSAILVLPSGINYTLNIMTLRSDKNLLPEFDSIKDSNEHSLWTERPKFVPFILSEIWGGVFIIFFAIIWFAIATNVKPENDSSGGWGIWMGLLPAALFLFAFLRKVFSFSNTAYAYSNKRVMMRTGFLGTDFKIIDYDKISDIEVTVNFVERFYNVGTIKFYSGRNHTSDGQTTKVYDNWEAIPNPYEVFKQVKEVMVDIKTDYNYPNALRPDTNPGYNTKYNRE